MKLPKLINEEEFEQILKAEKDKKFKIAYLLGFESGMRISEIIGLEKLISRCCSADVIRTRKEVDKKKLKILICSKCNKELKKGETKRKHGEWDIKPLQKEQIEGNSIRIIQGKGGKDRIVPKPKRLTEKAVELLPLSLSRRTLQRRFTTLVMKTIGKHLNFHCLRHGFCSHLANSGMQLHQVQMLAGHSNLSTTGIYLHANPKEAVAKAQELF